MLIFWIKENEVCEIFTKPIQMKGLIIIPLRMMEEEKSRVSKRCLKTGDFSHESFSLGQVSNLRAFESSHAYIPRMDIWNLLCKELPIFSLQNIYYTL